MSNHTISVTDAEFPAAVTQSDLPVLVDFWAPWCGPCRQVAPALEGLAEDYAGRLRIAKVNTDENYEQASKYQVRGIPTMVLFKDGVEVDRLVGAPPKHLLAQWIEQALETH